MPEGELSFVKRNYASTLLYPRISSGRVDQAVSLHELIEESDPNMEGGYTPEATREFLRKRAERRAEFESDNP